MNNEILQLINTTASIVQTTVLIGALWFAVIQVRESVRARATEAMRQVFEILSSPKSRNDRRFVYESVDANFDTMTKEQLQCLWDVAIAFNNVGLLLHRRYLPAETVYDIYGDAAVRCWNVLKPLLEQERQRRGEYDTNPYYLRYFEEFAHNSEVFIQKRYPRYQRLTYFETNRPQMSNHNTERSTDTA